jgi:hypothetical protein
MKKYFSVEKNVLRKQSRKNYFNCNNKSQLITVFILKKMRTSDSCHSGKPEKNAVRGQLHHLIGRD